VLVRSVVPFEDRLQLCQVLAVLTPRPRVNLVLYYGVLAPRAAWRAVLVPVTSHAIRKRALIQCCLSSKIFLTTSNMRWQHHIVATVPGVRVFLVVLVLSVMSVAAASGASGHEAEQQPAPASSTATTNPKGYVQAGLIMTVQPAGVANHRVTPPISGKALGMAVAAAANVTPAFSIEGEFVVGGTIATPQRFSYNWGEEYTSEVRDLLFNGNLRWRPRTIPHLELIGGGGLALSTFASRSIVRTDLFPTPRTTTLPDQVTTSRRPTLGGGIATPFPVSPSVEVAPLFRVRWVKRSADGLGAYAGVGSVAYHVGATVRFKL
jgi:hypothetical protein